LNKLFDRSFDTRDGRDKTRFAQFTRSIIRSVALALGVLVAYLQIKDIKPDALLTPASADIFWRIALVFYYWSWVSGINFDVNFQELALVSFPGQGRWPLPLYVALVIFVVMAAILLTSFGNIARFSLALTGFLVVDHASWIFVRLFLRRSFEDSRTHYATEKRFYELKILEMVESQMFGRWKLAKAGAEARQRSRQGILAPIGAGARFATPSKGLCSTADDLDSGDRCECTGGIHHAKTANDIAQFQSGSRTRRWRVEGSKQQ
jgi:hypothetical protein